jgi:DTW domain-containing protein
MELGTARLTALHLKNATLRIGLSWPSLGKALGRNVDPKRWAVLYLGSAKSENVKSEIITLNRKGTPAEDQSLKDIDGIIVLDGTWSQAKALWWRNAWMLKTRRIALNPRRPSRYGKLRREPRRDSVSTLEAAALLLSRLENNPEIETAMTASFEKLLTRYRAWRALSKAS